MVNRCNAKTRAGPPCRCPILFPNGRCRVHGGPRSKPAFVAPMTRQKKPRIWNGSVERLDCRQRLAWPVFMSNRGLRACSVDGARCDLTGLMVVHGKSPSGQAYWACGGCDARCAKLFKCDDDWMCHKCAGFTYRSSSLSGNRLIDKCARIMVQLRRMDSMVEGGRPKGMSRKVYRRWINRRDMADRRLKPLIDALELQLSRRTPYFRVIGSQTNDPA